MAEKLTYRYNDISICYSRLGEGKPLLILHGWGSSSRVMLPLARNLSRIRECYVLDLPGFGESDQPLRAWSIDDYRNMTEHFLRNCVGIPADLLVHSFGGRISLKLCAGPEGRDLVNKVLITGGAGMKPKRTPVYYIKKYSAGVLKLPFILLPASMRKKALDRLRETALWKSLGSKEYSELSGVMRETFVKSVTEHLESCLPEIPHEVLLLWGRDDKATPLYQAERMENNIEHAALVVIDKAGHYAFLDRPKHFSSIAEAFLNG